MSAGRKMLRPCNCDKCKKGEEYDLTQCRICWLYWNNYEYYRKWTPTEDGLPPAIICDFYQSPGDTLVASAGIASFYQATGGKVKIGVTGTAANDIYYNNPYITPLNELPEGTRSVRMENPLINECHMPYHFMQSYCSLFSNIFKINVPLVINRPEIYLTPDEESNPVIQEKHYWIIHQSVKECFTVKRYPIEYLQKIVDHFKGKIIFVQVGEAGHDHVPLKNVVDLIGKTTTRELLQLVFHCEGVVTGDSFPWHIAGALEIPAIGLFSGMLPIHWLGYQNSIVLSRHGRMDCCQFSACGKSKVIKNCDKDTEKDLCLRPVIGRFSKEVPKCLADIRPSEVITTISSFYKNGVIEKRKLQLN